MERPVYPLRMQRKLDELIKKGNATALKIKEANEAWVSFHSRLQKLKKQLTLLKQKADKLESQECNAAFLSARKRKKLAKKREQLQQEFLALEQERELLNMEYSRLIQKYSREQVESWIIAEESKANQKLDKLSFKK